LEETGFDITPYLEPENYIEITLKEQRIRLYIICGVSEDSEFIPRTRKEISVRAIIQQAYGRRKSAHLTYVILANCLVQAN
jgi:hypothetical protein